jgi:hypothetical protein
MLVETNARVVPTADAPRLLASLLEERLEQLRTDLRAEGLDAAAIDVALARHLLAHPALVAAEPVPGPRRRTE